MRILFVVPRSFNEKQMYKEYPLGVGILATLCRQSGHETLIYDGNVEDCEGQNVESWVEEFKPDVISYSIITPNYPVAKIEVARLRETYPDAFYIAGGLHPTLFPELVLDDGYDLVCLGEGERRFPRVIDALEAKTLFHHIDGVRFRDNGAIVHNPMSDQRVNLNDLPFVDRNVFNLKRYSHHSIVASRGCPYKCNFCCNYSGTILQKGLSVSPAVRVLDELEYLEKTFGATVVFFCDDIFFVKRNEILKFCAGYKDRGLSLKWIGQMRADTIDEEIAEAMAQAGCQRLYFGVESGSEDVLVSTNKRLTKQQLLAGTNAAKKAGIRVKTGWIFGLPGTLMDQKASIDFMLEMRPHEISVHQLIPFPGTPYYDTPELFGIRIRDKLDFESFCYGGISDNIQFDYLTEDQLVDLYYETAERLEQAGYVASDQAKSGSEYLYSTPINKEFMPVFRKMAVGSKELC
ncbi:B12-binding domain-containing radical SAM protein [Vibrio owensii]|uniref:B12-binding domain-containing radical SAM protein n=1 Tax=Vibrio owensii TaxID=696485 RepID=UPI0037478F99